MLNSVSSSLLTFAPFLRHYTSEIVLLTLHPTPPPRYPYLRSVPDSISEHKRVIGNRVRKKRNKNIGREQSPALRLSERQSRAHPLPPAQGRWYCQRSCERKEGRVRRQPPAEAREIPDARGPERRLRDAVAPGCCRGQRRRVTGPPRESLMSVAVGVSLSNGNKCDSVSNLYLIVFPYKRGGTQPSALKLPPPPNGSCFASRAAFLAIEAHRPPRPCHQRPLRCKRRWFAWFPPQTVRVYRHPLLW